MKLIFFSESNLRDKFFIKDFVSHYKLTGKSLLIHAPFGDSVSDNRFVTKRISALLSESMVYNNAFSADQRDLFLLSDGHMQIHADQIHKLLQPIQLLILGPLVRVDGTPQLADPVQMLLVARETLAVEEVLLFPANSRSPLAVQRPLVDTGDDVDRLLAIYEEEAAAIRLAGRLRPARIVSPTNYSA
ncbi:MAG: hypothetical protein OHK0039_00050 [Bacteroidia bacterium]